MIGIDTDSILNLRQIRELRSWGIGFVGRYLQTLTRREVEEINSQSLRILSIFEQNPTYPAYFSATQGGMDGEKARRLAQGIGQPEQTVIHCTVDTEILGKQFYRVGEYLATFAKNLAPYYAGVYASADVLFYASGPHIHSRWQTDAWSGSHMFFQADVYQLAAGRNVAGISTDIDWARNERSLWVPSHLLK